jgi:predicted Zn-dependent protease
VHLQKVLHAIKRIRYTLSFRIYREKDRKDFRPSPFLSPSTVRGGGFMGGFEYIRKKAGIYSFIIFLLLLGCTTVPLTGRRGLQLVSESQLVSMGVQQYEQVIAKSKLSGDKEKVEMVRRVGEKIARASEGFLRERGMEEEVRNYQWEFNLIEDDKNINAWAMPGGKVAVYSGILPIAQNENGLAVIMGHEVAHTIAKHGNERMSQGLLTQLGGLALSAALSQQPQATTQLFMAAYGVGANIGFLLPYSRLHESEADRIGLSLMARAGYDPRGAIPFWQRMNDLGKARPPEFLSTHPAPETRIRDLESMIPEAMRYYKGS